MRATSITRRSSSPAPRAAWAWRWICDPAPRPGEGCGKPGGFPRIREPEASTKQCGGGPVMALHGKRYEEARGRIDRESTYSPVQAVRMLKEFPGVKFDETVEVHFRLGLNV